MHYLKLCVVLCMFILKIHAQVEDSCRYVEMNRCERDAICTNTIDFRNYDNRCYYGVTKIKVHLSCTGTFCTEGDLPVFQYYDADLDRLKRYISDLDLGNNNFDSTPVIVELSNLASLNLSHNNLNSAKFYNKYKLESLTVLDLSHNVINGFVSDHETLERKYSFSSLLYLNMSNNYLTSIPIATFEAMSSLIWLDLSHNFIDILDVMSFDGIKRLQYLDLSNNRLVDLNSALLRFTELRHLYINYNSITKLNKKDFQNLINLRVLELRHNSILSLDHHVFANTANLNIVDLSYNLLNNVFDDVFSRNVTSLESVDMSYNKLVSLPKSMFKGSELSKFSIEGNNLIGVLQRGIFDGLQNVDVLNLSNQNLTSIDNYAFYGCNNLSVLTLKNNKLTSLEVDSMKALNKLISLDISMNKLKNIDFDKSDLETLDSFIARDNIVSHINKQTFANLKNLRYLDLSNNVIAYVEKYSFQSLTSLISLQIFNNPLDGVIEDGTLEGLVSLTELDLARVQLSRFNNGSLRGMNTLKKVNLSSNVIAELEYDAFSDAVMIEVIDLSDNHLTTFKVNPSTLSNLNSLILDYNNLTALTYVTFQKLHTLTTISVSNNNLSFIDNDTFRDQTGLQSLDMSYNPHLSLNHFKPPISLYNLFLSGTKADIAFRNSSSLSQLVIKNTELVNINALKLMNCNRILQLDLSHNRIVQIEGDAFFATFQLQSLDLSFNELSDIRPGVFRDNGFLYSLNMSHNSLISLRFGVFRGLQALDSLDLSYNLLISLKGERFYEVPSLRNLIIDYNNIQTIDDEEFAGSSLTYLSMGDNPLPCEILVKLKKKYVPFTITAMKLDHQRENVDGITCNRDVRNYAPIANKTFDDNSYIKVIQKMKSVLENNSFDQNQNIITIRDVLSNSLRLQNESINKMESFLLNYSISQSHNSDLFGNLSELLKYDALKLRNLTLENAEHYLKQTSITNNLLEKILNAFTGTGKHTEETNVEVVDPPGTPKVNNFTKIIQRWQDTITRFKTSILKEMDEKLDSFYMNHSSHLVQDNFKTTNEKRTSEENNNNSSLVFLEVCTCLTLLIIIAYVVLKFYKSNNICVRRRRTESTRNIPSYVDSPNL